jgi:polyhydroxyalkanoate synthase
MKYYILDLRPENSLVKRLVEAGFTVFMVSWRNPEPADRDIGFDDYRVEGAMAAIDVAAAVTGSEKVHAVGYCVGGTLLSVAAAAMARDGDARLKTVSLLVAQTDFEEAGELRTFIDESQLAILDDLMAESGVLEASQMAGTFHLLRSNDLIWSKRIHRYLLGENEPMDDITAWATDATRMPARMHSEYLRAFYLDNDLAEGKFSVAGGAVDLHGIAVPVFAVGAEWDYVAPWRSVHRIHRLADGEVTFVLSNRGHNQGIVSPPGAAGRHYRIATTGPQGMPPEPEAWLAATSVREGSWWPAWFGWLAEHSGVAIPPPPLGRPEAGYPAGVAAPGAFVHG